MSLLLDALKRAELANEQQVNENEPTLDDGNLPSDEIVEDGLIENESALTREDEPLALEPIKASESDAHVLPNMSFISDKSPISHSEAKQQNVHGKSSAALRDDSDSSIPRLSQQTASAESPQQLPPVSAQAKPTPYQPKSSQSNTWFIGSSVLALIIIGSSGVYYFIGALDQLSQDSNVSQTSPVTTVAEDIAIHKYSATDDVKKLPATPVNTANISNSNAPVAPSATLKKFVKPKKPSKTNLPKARLAVRPVETNTAKTVEPKTPLTIVRKKRIDPLQEILQKAYRAYGNSNHSLANQLYQKALRLKNNNRDALLGLAIIAHRSKQPIQARRYYRKILSLNPKDSQAAAGLIALAQGSNATESESRLKLLLEQEPQAAHLHFTLGNQYVNQARWADAQQAFFQAYHADPSNADYAMNLAISLDHINQPQAALTYYRLSLQLAQGKNVTFNVLDVAARIRTITKGAQQ